MAWINTNALDECECLFSLTTELSNRKKKNHDLGFEPTSLPHQLLVRRCPSLSPALLAFAINAPQHEKVHLSLSLIIISTYVVPKWVLLCSSDPKLWTCFVALLSKILKVLSLIQFWMPPYINFGCLSMINVFSLLSLSV